MLHRWLKLAFGWMARAARLARLRQAVPMLALAMALLLPAPPALAGTIPESERWATITHPGNQPYIPPPNSQYSTPPGRVDYEYQISRTETTGAEWLEFVQAYAPYVNPNEANFTEFTSTRVRATEVSPGVWEYSLRSGGANRAAGVGWRYAARYVNWLHNNKGLDQASFESGAYDTSTFGGNLEDGYTDQHARSPGARYFLPTIDEWIKAAYWDPNRVDPVIGDPGYWQFPNSSDTPLIPGVPGVGQTSAGQGGSFEVASYTSVQSPWGLWDLSGGATEWLETPALHEDGRLRGRWIKGTHAPSPPDPAVFEQDRIDWFSFIWPESSQGVRIARAIPTPGVMVALSAFVSVVVLKRRRS